MALFNERPKDKALKRVYIKVLLFFLYLKNHRGPKFGWLRTRNFGNSSGAQVSLRHLRWQLLGPFILCKKSAKNRNLWLLTWACRGHGHIEVNLCDLGGQKRPYLILTC